MTIVRERLPGVLGDIEVVKKKSKDNDLIWSYDPEDRFGAVDGVNIEFRVRERRAEVNYKATVSFNSTGPGFCQADVLYYIVEMRAVARYGDTPQPDFTHGGHDYWFKGAKKHDIVQPNDEDDAEADDLRTVFTHIEHPRAWYWQARACAVDKDRRKGAWSAWTDPVLPLDDARPSPPYPDNITLAFDKEEKGRDEARYRAKVRFTEIQFWDVPPTQERDAITGNLNGQLLAGAPTATLGSAASWPTPLPKERIPFAIRPNNEDEVEIASYSGKNGAQLTGLKRGLEGTTDRTHPDNANVRISASDLQERQIDLKGYQVQIRRCTVDGSGNFVAWVKDSEDAYVQRSHRHPWKAEDHDSDGFVRSIFPNIRKRHWWRARVRTVGDYSLVGEWSAWTNPGRPADTDAPPVPTNITRDVDPQRITIYWEADDDPDDNDATMKGAHPDIDYFQIQVSSRADFNKSLASFWREDKMHKGLSKSFRKKRKERGPFHIRVRSSDASGNRSAWQLDTKAKKTPGKVRNRSVLGRTRSVVVKYDPPDRYDGDVAPNAEFEQQDVSHYEIYVYRNSILYDQDLQVLSLRKSFPIPKVDSSGNWSAKVRAVGHEDDYAAEDAATGAAVPEAAGAESFSELTGSVSKPQMGTLGISRYGSTTAMNAAAAIDGDIWINTSFSPRRVYRYDGGSWTYQVSGDILQVGTVIADAIVAGAIDTHTLNSVTIIAGTFYTASSNPRISIVAGDKYVIRFTNSGGQIAGRVFMSSDADSALRLDSPASGLVLIEANTQCNGLLFGTNTGDPPTGFIRVYKDANNLMAKAPGRTAVVVAAL